jgi:hypothetical protein
MNLEIKNCNWEFRCPLKWEELSLTAHHSVRHCSECSQFVFLCETIDELRFHSGRRHCVALPQFNETDPILMGRYVLPPYKGATMTLTLEPTSKLDREQLEFLARSFKLSDNWDDDRSRVLGQNLPPDVAEELSQQMSDRGIIHRLAVDPD